jgi:3-oxoacyl-[acyl-carrier protein] reductase
MRLQGKVAIVTGSSSGIGLGVARAFAREGAAVVVNHPTPAEAAAAASAVRSIEAAGGRAVAVQADVSLEAD